MKLSEAIKQLQDAMEEFGDVECNEIEVDDMEFYDNKTGTYGHVVTIS